LWHQSHPAAANAAESNAQNGAICMENYERGLLGGTLPADIARLMESGAILREVRSA
jgi:hypothetical protein